MRLSGMVLTYFLIGSLLLVGGVIPPSEAGLVDTFVNDPTNDVNANDQVVNSNSGGILSGLKSTIENALTTVAGGTVLAVLGKINFLAGFMVWPVNVLGYMGAPWQVELTAGGTLLVSYIFGFLRVLRGTI